MLGCAIAAASAELVFYDRTPRAQLLPAFCVCCLLEEAEDVLVCASASQYPPLGAKKWWVAGRKRDWPGRLDRSGVCLSVCRCEKLGIMGTTARLVSELGGLGATRGTRRGVAAIIKCSISGSCWLIARLCHSTKRCHCAHIHRTPTVRVQADVSVSRGLIAVFRSADDDAPYYG